VGREQQGLKGKTVSTLEACTPQVEGKVCITCRLRASKALFGGLQISSFSWSSIN
jgi:hypothetical protein